MNLICETNKGFVLAVSAPSGTGKTSLCDKIAREFPFVRRSVSVTTRPMREGEVSGRDYEFVSLEEFKTREYKGELLETAEVFGHCYGTPKAPVVKAISEGFVIVMDIDTIGAFQVKRILKEDCITLFILPPSLEELERRLKLRGKNSPEELERRLKEASREIDEAKLYEYVLLNLSFDEAYEQMVSIVSAERAKVSRRRLSQLA